LYQSAVNPLKSTIRAGIDELQESLAIHVKENFITPDEMLVVKLMIAKLETALLEIRVLQNSLEKF
jgi:hypothetical protein